MPTYRIKCGPQTALAIGEKIFPSEGEYVLRNAEVLEIKDRELCWSEHPPEFRFPTVFVVPPTGRPIRYEIKCCSSCGKCLKNG